MADPSQQNTVTVAFAPPPPLWKHFTRENLDRFEQIKIEASKDHDGKPNHNKKWTPEELKKLEVPPELRFLVPPDVPTAQYSVFGELQPVRLHKLLALVNPLTKLFSYQLHFLHFKTKE